MREKLLITPLTVNDDAIQVARQDVRTAFWFLWIAAAVTLCGSLLDISWLKASEAGVYFWMGAFGLALLARLIINCTDHIITELSAALHSRLGYAGKTDDDDDDDDSNSP
jgi:hypothetical protein